MNFSNSQEDKYIFFNQLPNLNFYKVDSFETEDEVFKYFLLARVYLDLSAAQVGGTGGNPGV